MKKNLRRTVMRYVNLSTVLVYRLVSSKVKERFPDNESLIKANLILREEVQRLEEAKGKIPHEVTWLPLVWATKMCTQARKEEKIKVPNPAFAALISMFQAIEGANRNILKYGWVNFPLAYTQVATFAVYTYFFAALFGRQFLVPHGTYQPNSNQTYELPNTPFNATDIDFATEGTFSNHTPNFYLPIFTMIEFLCYFGWIKVAETLLNPFGGDDEDFQINYLIDRNLQVCILLMYLLYCAAYIPYPRSYNPTFE